mmetsp:Transcript_3995/g.9935  ORF Transcript_3995/g.9935 Transcript_3995/m.9935 type:complete len:207 (+) Transcript_3995:534-1154(+)
MVRASSVMRGDRFSLDIHLLSTSGDGLSLISRMAAQNCGSLCARSSTSGGRDCASWDVSIAPSAVCCHTPLNALRNCACTSGPAATALSSCSTHCSYCCSEPFRPSNMALRVKPPFSICALVDRRYSLAAGSSLSSRRFMKSSYRSPPSRIFSRNMRFPAMSKSGNFEAMRDSPMSSFTMELNSFMTISDEKTLDLKRSSKGSLSL